MLDTCVCSIKSSIMMCYLIVTLQKQLKYFLFPACLLFMHYITFVVMLFAGYLKFCIITYMWGYVIVALLCKIASEWYICILIVCYLSFWYCQRGRSICETKLGSTKSGGAFNKYKKCIIVSFSIIKKGEYVSTTSSLDILHDVKTGKANTYVHWKVSLCLVALLYIRGLRNH